MATTITTPTIEGYDASAANAAGGPESRNPHMCSSPNWFAFHAGRRLWTLGMTRPIKATMGRGYSVNVWTAASRFKVSFPGDDFIRDIVVDRIEG